MEKTKDSINVDIAFKPNDIRGSYPDQINKELFYKVGRAFVTFTKCRNVGIGYDMRVSSPILSKAFIKGVIDSGANAIDIGVVSTDVVYFASGFLDKSAVMITSSHNPAKNNGIKFLRPGAASINYSNGLKKIKQLVRENDFKKSKKKGKHIRKNVLKDFKKHVLSFIDKKRLKPFKVVIDAGNAMAGKMVPLIYRGLPMKIIPMYFKLDGRFPNHVPNPLVPKNNKAFLNKIKKTGADFGMIFDGDADRVFIANEKGKRITSSITSCVFVKYFLKKYPKQKIIYNPVMSKIVPETIRAGGGKPIVTKVGHSIIKNNMKKTKAIFGCEHSGHFYYKQNYAADSGIISSLIIYEILSGVLDENKKISEIVKKFQKYFKTSEYSIGVKNNKEKKEKLNKLESYYKKAKGVKKTSRFNGLTVWYDDFWFNLRPSDTEPFLRVNLEADKRDVMKRELKKLKSRVMNI